MKRLSEFTSSELALMGESTPVADTVCEILWAAGVKATRVMSVERARAELVLDVELQDGSAPSNLGIAVAVLSGFADGEVAWNTRSATSAQLRLPLRPPSDELELLGVGLREDPSTELLAHGLRHDDAFRTRFLDAVGLDGASDDWEWRTRPTVFRAQAEDGQGKQVRNKDVPDLVGFSRKAGSLIVVEHKLMAGEADGQTAAYSEPGFLDALSTQVGVERRVTKLCFLTPDGVPPEPPPSGRAERFEAMSYDALLPMLPTQGDAPLGRLLSTLRRRIYARATWPTPVDEAPAAHYLRVAWGLVTPTHVFRRFFEAVQPPGLATGLVGRTNHRSGEVLYAQLLGHSWTTPAGSGDRPGRAIHFELTWAPREERLVLFLHQETVPYVPHARLRDSEYFELHKQRKGELHWLLRQRRRVLGARGWNLRNDKWTHASHRFEEGLTVAEVRTKLADLTSVMKDAVDRSLRQLP